MKEIPLTRGKVAIVDDADYPVLSSHNWCCVGTRTISARRRKSGRIVHMHRELAGATDGLVVDHINGDTLDNRRCNLRVCTAKENSRNSRHGRGVSRYKGVQLRKQRNRRSDCPKWIAVIRVDRKLVYLGQFKTETDAAVAYDQAAIKHFGEFAKLNFDNTLLGLLAGRTGDVVAD